MSKQKRTLKLWNGRGHGKYHKKHISVAAYSKKQAAEIISIACNSCISVSEITNYYSDCWGNNMDGINPEEPCVYVSEPYLNQIPLKVY